jgi:hypothetical protein
LTSKNSEIHQQSQTWKDAIRAIESFRKEYPKFFKITINNRETEVSRKIESEKQE